MKIRAFMTLILFLLLPGCIVLDSYSLVKHTVLDPTDIGVSLIKHDKHYVREDSTKGSLYIFWSSTFATVKRYMSGIYVYVDGERKSAVAHGTYTVIDLPPGTYSVSIGDYSNIEKVRKIQVKKNDNLYYRVGIENNLIMPDSLYFEADESAEYAKSIISDATYVTLGPM